MKKIDAHAHIFERISSYTPSGELRPIGNGVCRWPTGEEMAIIPKGYGETSFLAESLLKIMDAEDIEKAILLQGSLYGFQNEYAIETAQKYPDRFKAAVTLDPFCKNADKILDHLIDHCRAKIVKFELSIGAGLMGYHHNFILDDEVMDKIYHRMSQEENMTLVLDIGSPKMFSCQPEAVERIAKKYPNLHIVICHLLAPHLDDEELVIKALPYLAKENIWVDLSALPWNVAPESYPYPTALRLISAAKDILGHKKILWGTDIPAVMTKFTFRDLCDYITDSEIFNASELEDVFYNNAKEAYYL